MDRDISPESLTMLLLIPPVGARCPLPWRRNGPAMHDLIGEGRDINAVNAPGRSALMSAVYYRNRGIVRERLVEGAGVNSVDGRGRRALVIAVANGYTDRVALRPAAGADPGIEDKSGNTVITLSGRLMHRELTRLPEDRVAQGELCHGITVEPTASNTCPMNIPAPLRACVFPGRVVSTWFSANLRPGSACNRSGKQKCSPAVQR